MTVIIDEEKRDALIALSADYEAVMRRAMLAAEVLFKDEFFEDYNPPMGWSIRARTAPA